MISFQSKNLCKHLPIITALLICIDMWYVLFMNLLDFKSIDMYVILLRATMSSRKSNWYLLGHHITESMFFDRLCAVESLDIFFYFLPFAYVVERTVYINSDRRAHNKPLNVVREKVLSILLTTCYDVQFV